MTYSQLGVIATRLAANISMLAYLCPASDRAAREKLVKEINEDLDTIKKI